MSVDSFVLPNHFEGMVDSGCLPGLVFAGYTHVTKTSGDWVGNSRALAVLILFSPKNIIVIQCTKQDMGPTSPPERRNLNSKEFRQYCSDWKLNIQEKIELAPMASKSGL
jgi:hypothetical protein